MNRNLFKPVLSEEVESSINVTSLVDVILTVLIIFMLIAPIMEQGISLNLPQATAEKIQTKEALTIEVDRSGQIYLDTIPVNFIDFRYRLEAIARYNQDQAILIRADEGNKYGDIVQIIDMIKQTGLTKVGIMTRPREKLP